MSYFKNMPKHFIGMHGLGDNIYIRGIVREFPGSVLRTPWPQLFQDLDISCVPMMKTLRTQEKNQSLNAHLYQSSIPQLPEVILRYHHAELNRMSIPASLAKAAGLSSVPLRWDLPELLEPEGNPGYVLIRPVTERKEWLNSARNPRPSYIRQAAAFFMKKGYSVMTVADLSPGQEWMIEDVPAHVRYEHGELSATAMLGLAKYARAVVSPVGWACAAMACTATPFLCVHGGNGHSNSPDALYDQTMDLRNVYSVLPDRFCMCDSMSHDCDKLISNFGEHLEAFAGKYFL